VAHRSLSVRGSTPWVSHHGSAVSASVRLTGALIAASTLCSCFFLTSSRWLSHSSAMALVLEVPLRRGSAGGSGWPVSLLADSWVARRILRRARRSLPGLDAIGGQIGDHVIAEVIDPLLDAGEGDAAAEMAIVGQRIFGLVDQRAELFRLMMSGRLSHEDPTGLDTETR